jgi:hypothetical protein
MVFSPSRILAPPLDRDRTVVGGGSRFDYPFPFGPTPFFYFMNLLLNSEKGGRAMCEFAKVRTLACLS